MEWVIITLQTIVTLAFMAAGLLLIWGFALTCTAVARVFDDIGRIADALDRAHPRENKPC